MSTFYSVSGRVRRSIYSMTGVMNVRVEEARLRDLKRSRSSDGFRIHAYTCEFSKLSAFGEPLEVRFEVWWYPRDDRNTCFGASV